MNKKILILVSIIFIATVLRFYNLATLPPSLEWDEVSTGYDAYSILKTGRDQYGHFLPFTFRSLDDYKPPLYTYLVSASIAVLGWNDFAVRFPAALLGVLAVVTTFGLTRKLFENEKVALLAALFLAVSPWHMNFSRLALETNSTIFFTTAAVWAFLKGTRNGKWLVCATLFFGCDLYLYHNARVFVPLLGLVLIAVYWRELLQQKKYVLVSALITAILVIRLIPILTSLEGTMRFAGTSIFSSADSLDMTELKNEYSLWREVDQSERLGIASKMFHSPKIMYGLIIIKNYISHFDPTFWLFTNDQPRHHVKELGIIYIVDLPFIYLGAYFLLKKNRKSVSIVAFAWILLAPVAASVTRDVPHALRAELMLPIFQILIAFGICGIYQYLEGKRIQRASFLIVVSALYFFNISFFLHQYFVHFAADTSQDWKYGRAEAALFAESIKNQYQRVIVSTKLEQPHIFFLYYLRYDPALYLRQGGTVSGGWAQDQNHFDKYYFMPIHFESQHDGRTLFVGQPSEFSNGTQPLKKIYYLNGTEAIWIVAG